MLAVMVVSHVRNNFCFVVVQKNGENLLTESSILRFHWLLMHFFFNFRNQSIFVCMMRDCCIMSTAAVVLHLLRIICNFHTKLLVMSSATSIDDNVDHEVKN